MFTVFQFTGIILAAGFVVGSSIMEVLFTLAVCFAFNSCDFNFDWESHTSYLHPNTVSELAVTAIMPFALPVLRVLHVLLGATCFLFISATTIYAMITVVELFFVMAKRLLVYILKGRHMLSQLSQRPTQPVVVDAHNLLQPAMVTSSILRSAGATRRPHDRHVKFSATHDTTCVYLKGQESPLAEQDTIVFSGASKLRDSSRRDIMAHYGMCRISQTYGTRHVAFEPALGMPSPAPEEEDFGVIDMEWEPIEDTATVDLVVAEEVGGVVDMEVEPIQEAATVDCKDQELREWMRAFCAIPTVSTPPAPAPAEKVEEVFEKEHVEVKDPIIGMWICFQPTAAQVTVAVSRKFVVYISFHTCNFHLTLVYCQFQLSNFLTDSRSTT